MVSVTHDRAAHPASLLSRVELISRPAGTPSGLSRYADTLARELQAAGVELHLSRTEMPGFLRPLARLGKAAGFDLVTFFENYPVRGRFERGVLHHLTSENLASLLVFQPLKPAIITIHGFFTYLLRNDPELRMYRHPLHQLFDRLAIRGFRQASHLICVSDYMKKVVVEEIGIPPSKVSVMREAVDHETFYPAPVDDSFYARYNLSNQHRYILFVGSEQPRKNFLTLIRAFARLRERVPDAHLLKVGRAEDEHQRQKALHLIDQLGLSDSVIFAGHVTDDLPNFYRLADVFVFPSLYEGFGFPPLEAMACGTPVICSNTTSLPEVVGDAGLLIQPQDEVKLAALMEQVLQDPRLHAELSQKGVERARLFHWRNTAQETIQVYQKVLQLF